MVDTYINKLLEHTMSIHEESKIAIAKSSIMAENEMQRLSADNDKLFQQNNMLCLENEHIKAENQQLKAENQQLKEQIKTLETKYISCENTITHLRATLNLSRVANKTLKRENLNLKDGQRGVFNSFKRKYSEISDEEQAKGPETHCSCNGACNCDEDIMITKWNNAS